jgi:hypothetical protein
VRNQPVGVLWKKKTWDKRSVHSEKSLKPGAIQVRWRVVGEQHEDLRPDATQMHFDSEGFVQ